MAEAILMSVGIPLVLIAALGGAGLMADSGYRPAPRGWWLIPMLLVLGSLLIGIGVGLGETNV